ncbi:kinase-like domain-containing protein [Plectosphaerella plurivora]|uniref:Kinase-like domain-containing protein n=1 Tax=Plectosphaerella plurivora TaxID=936078 RepID=A0A9P8VBX5_9PEZI|nr:kinase-like domain-containing protein [Plectosphaerella plurivora]
MAQAAQPLAFLTPQILQFLILPFHTPDEDPAIPQVGAMTVQQLIENKYIDRADLNTLMRSRFENDWKVKLDHKLPFDVTVLSGIIGHEHAVPFWEKQWEFLPPVFSPFSIQRYLADTVKLPYLDQRPLMAGSFGEVFEVEIDPAHQRLRVTFKKVVRKDIVRNRSPNDWQAELEALATLGLLSHPNIARLLGFYIFKQVPSFLFPKAEGGNLQDLLDSRRPDDFQEDSSFLIAMADLASAIAAVHDFTAAEVDLERIGFHHDVRAANILVDRHRYILADFGLAQLKDPSEGSSTAYRVRKGLSVAPECQDSDGNFKRHSVSQASDIWSLGCILLNILTYIHDGTEGVEPFEDERTFSVGNFEYNHFHQGRLPHPVVAKQIRSLKGKASRAELMALELVEGMLSIDPEQRPVAKQVELTSIRVALTAQCRDVLNKLNAVLEAGSGRDLSADSRVELARFNRWTTVARLNGSPIEARDEAAGFLEDKLSFSLFTAINDFLESLEHSLEENIAASTPTTRKRMMLPVRRSITALYKLLSPQSREEAQGLSEVSLLQTNNFRDLEINSRAAIVNGATNMANLPGLAKAKSSIRDLERNLANSAQIFDAELLSVPENLEQVFEGHLTGLIPCVDSPTERMRVLIEIKEYHDTDHKNILLQRLSDIVRISQAVENSEQVGIFPYIGFYRVPGHTAFGMVYSVPKSAVTHQTSRPTSLHQVLSPKPGSEAQPDGSDLPSMKRRLEIAYSIAKTLSSIHKVGWAHKNLSSYEIEFFPSTGSTVPSWSQKPFLVGFRYSHPDDMAGTNKGLAVYNEGPSTESPSGYGTVYQHSQNRERNVRYRLGYDYYSLGIVLLEIGFWKPIDKLASREALGPKGTRRHLIKRRLPWLKHFMGEVYCEAVSMCLGQEIVDDGVQDAGVLEQQQREIQIEFEANVLAPLSRLASLGL